VNIFREELADKAASLAAQGVYVGTSSWKYPGWCGLLYDRSYNTPESPYRNGRSAGAQPRRDSQEMANVAQSCAGVARRRAWFRAISCGFGPNPRLLGRGTLPAEGFGRRDRWITGATSCSAVM
jgi:hypothetical protein